MTDTELFDIVKGHREAWPSGAEWVDIGDGQHLMTLDGPNAMETMLLAFEASFHRALIKQTYSVRVEQWQDWYKVIVKHEEFDAPTLIEAYAKALEWLK